MLAKARNQLKHKDSHGWAKLVQKTKPTFKREIVKRDFTPQEIKSHLRAAGKCSG